MNDNHHDSALIIEEIKYRVEYVPHGGDQMMVAMVKTKPLDYAHADGAVVSELWARGADSGFIGEPTVKAMPLSRNQHRLALPKNQLKYFFDQTPVGRMERCGFMGEHLNHRHVVYGTSKDYETVTIDIYGDTTGIDPRAMDAVSSYLRSIPELERELASTKNRLYKMTDTIAKISQEKVKLSAELDKLKAQWVVRTAKYIYELWYKLTKFKK